MIVFIKSHEIAQCIEIRFFAVVQFSTGQNLIHDALGLGQVLVRLDRGQRKIEHKLQVRVSILSLQAELRVRRHDHTPRFFFTDPGVRFRGGGSKLPHSFFHLSLSYSTCVMTFSTNTFWLGYRMRAMSRYLLPPMLNTVQFPTRLADPNSTFASAHECQETLL
jgi:hypothetical protein